MKPTTFVLFATFSLLAACGNKAEASMADMQKAFGEAQQQMAAALPQMQAQMQQAWAQMGTTLATITDSASAQQAKASLQAMVADLQSRAAAAGGVDKLAASLGADTMKSLSDQVKKLASDPAVKQAVGPMLDQLKALLGTK